MTRWASCALALLLAAGFASAAEKELHVVASHVGHAEPRGISKPGVASVTVDRPGKEVVLVLNAYNPVKWDVSATPKTTITKVLLCGYHAQSATVPKGVVVEELYYENRKERGAAVWINGYYKMDTANFRVFVQTLHEHTGLEVSSFQGTYQFDPGKPFFVDAIQKDERLHSDFPKITPAGQVPKFKFEGTRLVTTGRRITSASFGEFTQKGPNKDALTALPKGILQVAYDPNGKQHYGITGHELHAVNIKDGSSNHITAPPGIDPNWLRALTFDAKRDRVLITGRNALYEYTTNNGGAWAILVKKNGSYSAITWQKSTDTLFAIGNNERARENRDAPILYELNANGTVAKMTTLGLPMFPAVMEGGAFDRAELIDLGGELAVIIWRENRDSDGDRGKREAFLFVIDPKTGKTKLAWKE